MNTNDLPPAARLAALIEAGRAANPDLIHGRGILLRDGAACGLGFACLAAGLSRSAVADLAFDTPRAAEMIGVPHELAFSVAWDNDKRELHLDELVHSLREGRLAKVAV